jgi:hypothetical protein
MIEDTLRHTVKEESTEFMPALTWRVQRFASLHEVVNLASGKIRYKVTVWDEGRPPFLVQWFNDPTPASDFIDQLRSQGVKS